LTKGGKMLPSIMGQPVKLTDELVLDARMTAKVAERSIAGQIEFWAQLGRAIEPLLRGDKALALRRSGNVRPLSEALETVDSDAGRELVRDYLAAQPFPHFEAAPDCPGMLIKIEKDGSRTLGRFVNREFQPEPVQ
jgi:hypothetical protein